MPCFCEWVDLESSEQCFLHWAQVWGDGHSEKTDFVCVAWGSWDKVTLSL